MKVKELLNVVSGDVIVKILQVPILDSHKGNILRTIAPCNNVISSNGNYLENDVVQIDCKQDFVSITCEASKEQVSKVILG